MPRTVQPTNPSAVRRRAPLRLPERAPAVARRSAQPVRLGPRRRDRGRRGQASPEQHPRRGGAAEGGFVIKLIIRVFGRSAPIKPQSQNTPKYTQKNSLLVVRLSSPLDPTVG